MAVNLDVESVDGKVARKKNKVCIVGCADSKNTAPFHEHETMEFWGVNNLWLHLADKPWTRWFEPHTIEFDGTNFIRRGSYEFRGQSVNEYMAGLAKLPCPVYMQRTWPQVPNSALYPIKEVTQKLGRYFTNTISYMIAVAILERFDEMHIYGVDMAQVEGGEYARQRPSCEYFIGMAVGMGIKVVIPDEADILKTRHLYGFEEEKESEFQKKLKNVRKSMEKRMNQAMFTEHQATRQKEQYIGAIAAVKEIASIWK